jgi:hypothetical protein
MTINDEMAGFDDNSGDIAVSVAVRMASTPPALSPRELRPYA